MRRDEPKSVLENVALLERENAELKVRIDRARAEDALEDTIQTRPRPANPRTLRAAAAIAFGLAFGLVTLALTLLLMPPGSPHYGHELRGGSAGVCR